MKGYKVYKKIRQRATILGMPALNFWFMVIINGLLFTALVFGFSFIKVLIIALLAMLNFLFCKYLFNIELLGNITIKDYYRNKRN